MACSVHASFNPLEDLAGTWGLFDGLAALKLLGLRKLHPDQEPHGPLRPRLWTTEDVAAMFNIADTLQAGGVGPMVVTKLGYHEQLDESSSYILSWVNLGPQPFHVML